MRIPLTITQLTSLSRPVLKARPLFPLALEIYRLLKLSPGESLSRVLAHWVIYKAETRNTEEAETARQVRSVMGSGYSARVYMLKTAGMEISLICPIISNKHHS